MRSHLRFMSSNPNGVVRHKLLFASSALTSALFSAGPRVSNKPDTACVQTLKALRCASAALAGSRGACLGFRRNGEGRLCGADLVVEGLDVVSTRGRGTDDYVSTVNLETRRYALDVRFRSEMGRNAS